MSQGFQYRATAAYDDSADAESGTDRARVIAIDPGSDPRWDRFVSGHPDAGAYHLGAWAEILRVNLIGPFLAIKYAGPLIAKRGGGSIVCTASVAGLRSGAGGAAYSASKAGVINLVQTAAQQLSVSGVRVNAICPGLIETGMTQPLYDLARASGQEERLGELNPLRRGGEPREIAQAALFLASDDSSYVNGTALVVDGGLSSSHPTTRRFELRML